jgi:hypothetical protein
MKLYEIKDQYLELLRKIENDEIPEDCIADTLEGVEGEFQDKADNIACLIKQLEAEGDAINAEVDSLKARATQKQVKADRLKEYLFNTFKTLGKDKIETARNVLQVKKNPASVSLVEGFDNIAYMTTKTIVAPDKELIKRLLKDGVEIDGARLETKERLVIK